MEREIKSEPILEKKDKNKGWVFYPCPFCGRTDIGVKDTIIDVKAGHDCPSSAIRRIWAYCRYCGAEGPKTVLDIVYDEEEIAAALVIWNRREEAADE